MAQPLYNTHSSDVLLGFLERSIHCTVSSTTLPTHTGLTVPKSIFAQIRRQLQTLTVLPEPVTALLGACPAHYNGAKMSDCGLEPQESCT